MQPSSLALIAIVAVWAAYLVPHWVHRRDQLAQSRTHDRDSARLRLLAPRRRSASPSAHRSGGPVLSSPRIVLDDDGEPLFIPADRPSTRFSPKPAATHSLLAIAEAVDAAGAASSRAARRRGWVLLLLLAGLVAGLGTAVTVAAAPGWVWAPMLALVAVHLVASRVAAVRSRENLAVLRAQLRTAEALAARAGRPPARPAAPRRAPFAPSRPGRPGIAVGDEPPGTWQPVPVPPPTYTLKPAVRRPEPPPLPEAPAAAAVASSPGSGTVPAGAVAAHAGAAPDAASRGALPRRAEDIERILAMDDGLARAVNQ